MPSRLIIGCGYLGLRVAEMWLAQSDRVWVTTRSSEHATAFRERGLEPFLCDVLAPPASSWPQVDTVLYAVGLDRRSGASMRSVYVEGLARVLEALPAPERFVYVSSTSVYGQTEGEEVDETAATVPLEENGRIVLEAEFLLRARRPQAIILRFAGIYGPGRVLRRQTLDTGQPIVGDPDRWLNLIHVADGAQAVLAAAERAEPGGTYNISDGQPVRRRDFYAVQARLLGVAEPRWVLPDPNKPLPAHERAQRRIGNHRMRDGLHVAPQFPDYTRGLVDAISQERASPPT